MHQLMFIPPWGVSIGSMLLVSLGIAIIFLRKQVEALEERADEIEEVQEARRKGRM